MYFCARDNMRRVKTYQNVREKHQIYLRTYTCVKKSELVFYQHASSYHIKIHSLMLIFLLI